MVWWYSRAWGRMWVDRHSFPCWMCTHFRFALLSSSGDQSTCSSRRSSSFLGLCSSALMGLSSSCDMLKEKAKFCLSLAQTISSRAGKLIWHYWIVSDQQNLYLAEIMAKIPHGALIVQLDIPSCGILWFLPGRERQALAMQWVLSSIRKFENHIISSDDLRAYKHLSGHRKNFQVGCQLWYLGVWRIAAFILAKHPFKRRRLSGFSYVSGRRTT